MKGTHNSLSYLPVAQWWLKPFFWVARCQSKNIVEQYNSRVRWFDIRCKMNDKGSYISGHGLVTYDVSIAAILSTLSECCKWNSDVTYVRLMLEDNSNRYSFVNAVSIYKKAYPSLRFVDARIKSDFSVAVPGVSVNESHEYQLFQDYSAKTILQKIKGFKFPCPWYWDRKNKKNLSKDSVIDNIFHIKDFV